MGEILIADTETNGFKPDRIWVLGILKLDTGEYTSYENDDVVDGLIRLSQADLIIGHNFKAYDAYHIKRITGGLIDIPKERIVDTLEMSRKLCDLKNHTLDTWGEILGIKKTKDTVPNFDQFWPEMVPYCKTDCIITKEAYTILTERHIELYGTPF